MTSIPAFLIWTAREPPAEELHTVLVSGEKAVKVILPADGMRLPVSGPTARTSGAAGSRGSMVGEALRNATPMPLPPRKDRDKSSPRVYRRCVLDPRSIRRHLRLKG